MATKRNIWKGVLPLVLVAWTLVGFGPWLVAASCPTWLANDRASLASQLGDSFGLANSLFSGLALVGVVYAIMLQRRELEATVASQKEQARIAATTARMQAFAFLAELHYRMLDDIKGDRYKAFHDKAEYYANRSVELMRDLGETFPVDLAAASVEIPSQVENALLEIHQIAAELNAAVADDSEWNDVALNGLADASRKCRNWLKEHDSLFTSTDLDRIKECVGPLHLETDMSLRLKRPEKSQQVEEQRWNEWWEEARSREKCLRDTVDSVARSHQIGS